ncbi:hypothetical protein JCM10207_002782 [Rhodosporidiobolus poonsookiae]
MSAASRVLEGGNSNVTGSWLTWGHNTFPDGLGSPLNLVITGDSDTDSLEAVSDYLYAQGQFRRTCKDEPAREVEMANLGDGQGGRPPYTLFYSTLPTSYASGSTGEPATCTDATNSTISGPDGTYDRAVAFFTSAPETVEHAASGTNWTTTSSTYDPSERDNSTTVWPLNPDADGNRSSENATVTVLKVSAQGARNFTAATSNLDNGGSALAPGARSLSLLAGVVFTSLLAGALD